MIAQVPRGAAGALSLALAEALADQVEMAVRGAGLGWPAGLRPQLIGACPGAGVTKGARRIIVLQLPAKISAVGSELDRAGTQLDVILRRARRPRRRVPAHEEAGNAAHHDERNAHHQRLPGGISSHDRSLLT